MVVVPGLVKLRRSRRFGTSCRVRSSRSVTCLSVSSRVAPARPRRTTMVRNVNAGSSARPRLKKALTPAAMATIIRYTTTERLVMAHSKG